MDLQKKIGILADSAKYDVSCSSSGSHRSSRKGGLGASAPSGICHSWSEDGRCISLLKILLTNSCMYDCDYCINRRSNDLPRAAFTIEEIVDLTLDFYRRNYIEGLFLSSGVVQSPDYTMEQLVEVARRLREKHRFNGYIHMKAIPGADPLLVDALSSYVDRVSVNIELPKDSSLALYAPDKTPEGILSPMNRIKEGILQRKEDRKTSKKVPLYAPAGQTTQMIVGAGGETDFDILQRSQSLYRSMHLKRVYYSAYVPVSSSKLLKHIPAAPLLREHRIYQSDFLLRFYRFQAEDLLSQRIPDLDPHLDPKAFWALNHPDFFPVEVNLVDYETLLRVPGIGPTSAKRILISRRLGSLQVNDVERIGLVWKKARHFILIGGRFYGDRRITRRGLKQLLSDRPDSVQLSFLP